MTYWKHQAGDIGPDEETEGLTMRQRAESAEKVVKGYVDDDLETCMKDLVTDIMHLCDREGIDGQDLLDRAYRMYLIEISKE